MRSRRVWLGILGVLLLALPGIAMARDYTPQEEERLGKEGAAELEKQYGVVQDADQLKRIDAILKVIAPCTERPNIVYKAKILKTPEVNALSLPGGIIFVTKGLLDEIENDDELAGVLAHEVGHNAHKHALQQLDRSNKFDQKMLMAMLAALVVSRARVDPGQLMLIGQVLKMNALSGYGQQAELEADHSGVDYLVKSKRYNPVGMLQFMEILQRDESHRPEIEPFFRSHPPTTIRVDAIRDQLTAAGVAIVRLPGKNTPVASARAVTVNGKNIAEVVLRGEVLFQPASTVDGKDPLARAQDAAQRVSVIFREYAAERHVHVQAEGEDRVVYYRDAAVIRITPDDARFHNTTADELASRAAKALRKVIWDDFVRSTV